MPYAIPNDVLDSGDIAFLGQKGSGKTYAAKGLVERLVKRSRRVVVIDPMGIWHGLNTMADGSPGLPVLVVGGEHADIPFPDHTPDAGRQVAQLIHATTFSVVVDVADVRKPANFHFVAALLNELYQMHTTKEAIWLVLEEADLFAAQFARSKPEQDVLAVVDHFARRGRARGWRLISITQRPAKIAKDVLSQFTTMAVLALPGLQDRKAARDWMDGVTPDTAAFYNALPTLDTGEAFIWIPKTKGLMRDRFPTIATLDTSQTPGAGTPRTSRRALTDAQLAEIRALFDDIAGVRRSTTVPRVRGSKVATPTTAGRAITELRHRLRLSQEELAEKIGSAQKSLSRAETGATNVSTRLLEDIARETGTLLRIAFVDKEQGR